MRVYLDMTSLDGALAKAVSDHVTRKWVARGVRIWRSGDGVEEDSARLVIGNGQSRVMEGGVVCDRVSMDSDRETDRDELFFRIDAKLGRLVHSEMAANRKSLIRTGGPVSRRDLFLGIRHFYQMTSGLPVHLGEKCEAKYGCTKCVESCPVEAISINGGVVTIDGGSCNECGLCAASCPTGAVQMPWFSEEALLGMLDGIDESPSGAKSLVITCRKESVPMEPWVDVEEVVGVGAVGRRELAAAAGSSLGAVIVYCPDGLCKGADGAKKAAEAVSAALERTPKGGPTPQKIVAYLEGGGVGERIASLHRAGWPDQLQSLRRGVGWSRYVDSLNRLAPEGTPAVGLGFFEATVNQTCTLCGDCVRSCPHGAFRLGRGELSFNPGECTGCGLCVGVCPQKSIGIEAAGVGTTFPLAPHPVYREAVVACKGCGQPVGPRRFLDHVSEVAHIDPESLSYCPRCIQKISGGKSAQKATVGSG